MKLIKKNKVLIFSLIIVFLISLIFPFSGDDLQWQLGKISLNMIKDFSCDISLNGRYMGNILVTIMTKNIFIRGIFISTVLLTTIEMLKKETKTSSLIIWLLLITMPLPVLNQTIIWSSGFTNYVISTLFLLISLKIIRNAYNNEEKIQKSILNIIILLLSSLFIENLTVFLLLFTLCLNIIYIIKNKKIKIPLISTFLGSLIGTIIMFIHPVYHNVLDGTDVYRNYASGILGIIERSIKNYVNVLHKYIAFENIVVIFLIIAVMFIYFRNNKKNYSSKQIKALNILFIYQIIYTIYIIICRLNPNWNILLKYTVCLNALLTAIYIITLLIMTIILFYKNKNFLKIIMPLIIIIGLVAPLCIVNPIGPRNFYMVYVLEILFFLYILKEAKIEYKKYYQTITIIIVMLLVYYTSIYGYICLINMRRDNYIINKAKNTDETLINVPRLPYPEYVWGGDFDGEYRTSIYLKTKNLRLDIRFNFLIYEDWLAFIENENKDEDKK